MSINSLNSGSSYASLVQPQSQTYAEQLAERERNTDNGEGSAAVMQNSLKPTVNTQGEMVGYFISVEA
jgi:hypothetical protein